MLGQCQIIRIVFYLDTKSHFWVYITSIIIYLVNIKFNKANQPIWWWNIDVECTHCTWLSTGNWLLLVMIYGDACIQRLNTSNASLNTAYYSYKALYQPVIKEATSNNNKQSACLPYNNYYNACKIFDWFVLITWPLLWNCSFFQSQYCPQVIPILAI